MRLNLKHPIKEFAIGMASGFPLCCVTHYCLDAILHKEEQRNKRKIRGLLYVPCRLHMWAKKQTYERAVIEEFLDSGFLEDKDYWLLPDHIKPLVINPPKQ
jgi:hypothetical protein